VKTAQAQLPYFTNLLLQAELSMDVLTAEKPGATEALITAEAPIPVAEKLPVLAAPTSVIANRPDVRAAERKLASATAEQGVAVAQFFPDVSLSGFLGLLNTDLGQLLRTGSKSWDLGGNVMWPILNYGKLEAGKHAADARQQEALGEYRKAVLVALSDVQRSATAYTKEEDHRAALQEAVDADRHAVKIARERYKAGLSAFLEVLDAERTLYTAQAQAATSSAMTSENLIAVYKSLGGGWQEPKPEAKKPEEKAPEKPVTN
jgi:NodT family efflux transporter outer membrane factor (OMF) lipoprotein